LKSTLRFYNNIEEFEKVIEIETFLKAFSGSKEVTINIQTEIKNGKEFYTDSNGLEMYKKVLNQRDFNLQVSQPVAGNYMPINPIIMIEDQSSKERVLYSFFASLL